MLDIASERDSSGDVFLQDMGCGLPFRPGVFDGCISISAVQWLCYSDKKEQTARKRLTRFFSTLYTCLKRGSRAVLQLYPETPEQMEEISGCAMRCGFSGGLVIDYPNSAKAKKFYLCLFAGYDAAQQVPQGLGGEGGANEIAVEGRRKQQKVTSLAHSVFGLLCWTSLIALLLQQRRESVRGKDKDWVLAKKDRYRKQGKEIKNDSKFTARRRPSKF
jgi:18S rRNA (guanine1575-N7)-methyltransferase